VEDHQQRGFTTHAVGLTKISLRKEQLTTFRDQTGRNRL